jgi:integrase
VQAVIDAATCERDHLLLRVLWATGARVSEVVAVRPMDVQLDHLVLPNRNNPNVTVKRVFLPAGQADLPGAPSCSGRTSSVSVHADRCSSRRSATPRQFEGDQSRASVDDPLGRVRAGGPCVSSRDARRTTGNRGAGPCRLHQFRHAGVRQIVRTTRNLSPAQRQAVWSRLRLAYLTVGDEEACHLMWEIPE